MLQITDSVEDQGTVVWQLALCSLIAWVIVYFCIFRGVKLVGKVGLVHFPIQVGNTLFPPRLPIPQP